MRCIHTRLIRDTNIKLKKLNKGVVIFNQRMSIRELKEYPLSVVKSYMKRNREQCERRNESVKTSKATGLGLCSAELI